MGTIVISILKMMTLKNEDIKLIAQSQTVKLGEACFEPKQLGLRVCRWFTKINSKWIKDLNVRPETIKLLEENIGKTLSDINHSRILYDPNPRILETKAKVNKWDLMKHKFVNF